MPSGNLSFVANFVATSTITTAVAPAGAGTISSPSLVDLGTSFTATATPNPGYIFAGWAAPTGTNLPTTAITDRLVASQTFRTTASAVRLVATFTPAAPSFRTLSAGGLSTPIPAPPSSVSSSPTQATRPPLR